MSDRGGDDAPEPPLVEGSTAEWAIERAEELDVEPHEFLTRVLAAFREAEAVGDADLASAGELEALEDRIDELDESVDEKIDDVRQRVIQVKRETDEKAPADHAHPEFAERLERTASELSEVEATLAELEETLSETEGRLDRGFENFEEILEYLIDRTDEMEERLETLGSALLDLRRTVSTQAEREQDRRAAERIKRTAASRGVRKAKCDACGSKIDLALLAQATCPTCEAEFRELDANPGFFGTSVLETGRRPALEGGTRTEPPEDLESVVSPEEREGTPKRPTEVFETTGMANTSVPDEGGETAPVSEPTTNDSDDS
ncbi:MAG: hypothetical protein ABEI31_01570 [Halodesulfurarchaeum sp.]